MISDKYKGTVMSLQVSVCLSFIKTCDFILNGLATVILTVAGRKNNLIPELVW